MRHVCCAQSIEDDAGKCRSNNSDNNNTTTTTTSTTKACITLNTRLQSPCCPPSSCRVKTVPVGIASHPFGDQSSSTPPSPPSTTRLHPPRPPRPPPCCSSAAHSIFLPRPTTQTTVCACACLPPAHHPSRESFAGPVLASGRDIHPLFTAWGGQRVRRRRQRRTPLKKFESFGGNISIRVITHDDAPTNLEHLSSPNCTSLFAQPTLPTTHRQTNGHGFVRLRAPPGTWPITAHPLSEERASERGPHLPCTDWLTW